MHFLRLLPLLILYGIASWLGNREYLRGDESRYLVYAENILKGFFASEESLMYWNGPGYPLFLVPFVHWQLPLAIPRLGNAFFLFATLAYFNSILVCAGVKQRSILYTYGVGLILYLHGPLLDMLMSESLCALLVCGATYHFFRLNSGPQSRYFHLFATGLHLGYLVWTKVFFGYALELALFLILIFWGYLKWSRASGKKHIQANIKNENKNHNEKDLLQTLANSAAVCAIALVFCLPYLAYTYSQTGKIHFWGNSGGVLLYCLTVPEKELTGDWLNFDMVRDHPDFFPVQAPIFMEMAKLDLLSRDAAFKKAALANIRAHPNKFFRNWRANINRMVFGFPVSAYPGANLELTTGNRSLVYGIPFLVFLLALIPGWMGRKLIPMAAHLVLSFAFLSLGGLSLLSSIPRQAFPLIPLILLWTILVFEKTLVWRSLA